MRFAPLSTGLFITSILGLIGTIIYWPRLDMTWAFTLVIFFGMLFIANMISITYATSAEHLITDMYKPRQQKKSKKK